MIILKLEDNHENCYTSAFFAILALLLTAFLFSGQPCYDGHTGTGSITGQILFRYMVLANSRALAGGAIQATLTHSAITFTNHEDSLPWANMWATDFCG